MTNDFACAARCFACRSHLRFFDATDFLVDRRHVDIGEVLIGNHLPTITRYLADARPLPAARRGELQLVCLDFRKRLFLPNLPCLHQPRLLGCDPLQQLRRRFVVRVLRHQLSAHGQIENEASQARDRVRSVGDLFVMGQQPVGVHRVSASVRIAFNRSRKSAASASATDSFSSNAYGSL